MICWLDLFLAERLRQQAWEIVIHIADHTDSEKLRASFLALLEVHQLMAKKRVEEGEFFNQSRPAIEKLGLPHFCGTFLYKIKNKGWRKPPAQYAFNLGIR